MPLKKITVKSVNNPDSNNKIDEEVLNDLFPLIVRPLRTFEVWPSPHISWKQRIIVCLSIFYVQGAMLTYIIKHRDNFLEVTYGIYTLMCDFYYL